MRVIDIVVTGEALFPSSNLAGYSEDNQSTQLRFRLPPGWAALEYNYFLLIRPAEGNLQISEQLMPENGEVSFELPSFIMMAGEMRVQLRIEQGVRVMHAPSTRLWVVQSVGGEIPDPDATGLLTQWQDRVSDMTQQAETALEELEEALETIGDLNTAANLPVWNLSVSGYTLRATDGDIKPPITQNIEEGYTFVAALPNDVTSNWSLSYDWIDEESLTVGGELIPFDGDYAAGRHILQRRSAGIVSLGMLGAENGGDFGGGGDADLSVLEKVITQFSGGASGPPSEIRIRAAGEKADDRYYNHHLFIEAWVTKPNPSDSVPGKWFAAYVTTGWMQGANQSNAAAAIVVNTPGRSSGQINGTFAVANAVYSVPTHSINITGLQNYTSGSEMVVRIRHLDGLDISQWTVEVAAP